MQAATKRRPPDAPLRRDDLRANHGVVVPRDDQLPRERRVRPRLPDDRRPSQLLVPIGRKARLDELPELVEEDRALVGPDDARMRVPARRGRLVLVAPEDLARLHLDPEE